MIINDDIRTALKKAVEDAGNVYKLSQKFEKIRHTTIRDWLSGKTKSISDENWQVVYPFLEEFLEGEVDLEEYDPDSLYQSVGSKSDRLSDPRDFGSFGTNLLDQLSNIEKLRLMRCIKGVAYLKKKYSSAELEFEFTAELKESSDERLTRLRAESDGYITDNDGISHLNYRLHPDRYVAVNTTDKKEQ